MMKLFKYEGFKVTISEEALLLKKFKIIWDRDKTKSKATALQELGFIYFYCDPRSDYQYITDSDDRKKAIITGEGLPDDWEIDDKLQDAIDLYNTFKPTSALLLEDTRVAVDKLRKKLRDIDLDAIGENGKDKYTLNVITSTIKQVPLLIKDLDSAEKSITKEMVQSSDKMRGSGEKTIFDDDLSI